MDCRSALKVVEDHPVVFLLAMAVGSLYWYFNRWEKIKNLTKNIPGPPQQPFSGSNAIFTITANFSVTALTLQDIRISTLSAVGVLLYFYATRWGRVKSITKHVPGPPQQPFQGTNAIFTLTSNFSDVNHIIHRLFDKYGQVFKLWNVHEMWICVGDSQLAKDVTQFWKSYEAVPTFNFFSYAKPNFFITNTKCPVRQSFYDVVVTPTLHQEAVTAASDKLVKDLKSAAGSQTLSPEGLKSNIVGTIKEVFKSTDWKLDAREDYRNRIHLPFHDRLDLCLTKAGTTAIIKLAKYLSKAVGASEEVQSITLSTVSYENKEKEEISSESMLSSNELKLDFPVKRLSHLASPIADFIASELSENVEEIGIFLVTLLQEVAAHPEVLKKLREEGKVVRTANEGRNPTLEQERKLNYTEMVIKEGLRHYAKPGLFYRAGKEFTKGHLTIPVGSLVYICTDYLHKDPDHFEKPITFFPEHFTFDREKNRSDGAYFPLNLNPPQCTDDRIALKLMKIILSSIVANFKLETTTRPEQIERDYFLMKKSYKSINLKCKSL